GYMPIRQSTFNSTALQSYYDKTPPRKVGPQQINNAIVPSTFPAWDLCRDFVTTNYTAVLSGQAADAGVTKAGQQCTSALAQG
ncbi:MAG TPA: ABC transporter substrate-binding protein, partial [Ktedonosporobacter sp.]|nr:ABC transporter substrate-binding protein [Ktedonosporobacter sp.]